MLRDGESDSGKCRKSLTEVELDKEFEDSEKKEHLHTKQQCEQHSV